MGPSKSPLTVRRGESAFTLIELLVVVAIIAILAALLLPALARSKKEAFRVQCFNNQHEIGLCFRMYADDNLDYFPIYNGWAASGGQLPPTPDLADSDANPWYGGTAAVTNRPLDRYMQNVNTFHCPADSGDPLNPAAKTCWDGWGNSYLAEWYSDDFQVQHVTGSAGAIYPLAQGITMSMVSTHPVNKIIQGDWDWHFNRNDSTRQATWHNNAGNRRDAMLWGDSHVSFFQFPPTAVQTDNTAPDPNYIFW
jgi:prepilin-type N-terminal cleavage/methylation domain-containing protein